ALSCRGQALVDGWGGARVVRHLESAAMRLRPVADEDCRRVWEWANDPAVRAVSFSPEPIPWERHVDWFRGRLRDRHCFYFIGSNGVEDPVGQVRCELTQDEAVLSISLAPGCRGQGYGPRLIWLACEEVFRTSSAAAIHAYIKGDNRAS